MASASAPTLRNRPAIGRRPLAPPLPVAERQATADEGLMPVSRVGTCGHRGVALERVSSAQRLEERNHAR